MLVILSDLHLCDHTAMERNATPEDLRAVIEEIYALARTELKNTGGPRQLDIVLLGDVFDLLRTERWLVNQDGTKVPLAERPWANGCVLDDPTPPQAALIRARAIAQDIAEQNADFLSLLRGEGLQGSLPANCEVRRIYISGNHDRLYLHDPHIRDIIRKALGTVDEYSLSAEGIFPHRLMLPRYGVLAQHGHECDAWNFERYRGIAPRHYANEEYLFMPIGDVITTELVVRLPYELRQRLQAHPAFADTKELARVCDRLRRIEDVRPLMSSFQWIFFESERLRHKDLSPGQMQALREGLRDSLIDITSNFLQLDFYQAWRHRHRRVAHIDVTDKLGIALTLLNRLNIGALEFLAKLLGRRQPSWPKDLTKQNALREDLAALGTAKRKFVVYGHTHEPLEVALRSQPSTDLYLNSGTWRRRQHLTQDGRGFVGWQRCTYLVFYSSEERGGRGPGFESWQGSLHK